MEKKEDLRIKKTKANLYKGLLQLMEEKSFEEIKVIDICKVALINRSTFYDHFTDKYELLTSLMEDSKLELLNNLKSIDVEINSVKEYYMLVVKVLIDFINKNIDIYSILSILKKNNNSVAHDMMFDACKTAVLEKLNEQCINHSTLSMDSIVLFYVSGVVSFLTENVLNVNRIDEEKLLRELNQLIPDLDYLELKKDSSLFNN